MKANRYVTIIDDGLVFKTGKYKVGSRIPIGEYYFWGDDIWLTIYFNGDHRHCEYTHDAYITLEKGDALEISNGRFTPVTNISYRKDSSNLLLPNHLYRVGAEMPTGYYIYRLNQKYYSEKLAFGAVDDAALNQYAEYPYSNYYQNRGRFGIAEVKSTSKYFEVVNGQAIYLGDSSVDLYSALTSASFPDDEFHQDGKTVFANPLLNIRVFQCDHRRQFFHGKKDAVITEQYLFMINDVKFWAGAVKILSFVPNGMIKFSVENKASGRKYLIGDGHPSHKPRTEFSYSSNDDEVRWCKLPDIELYEIRLPDNVPLDSVSISSILLGQGGDELIATPLEVSQRYTQELERLAKILKCYQDIGLSINIEKEITTMQDAPDLVPICANILEKCFAEKERFDRMELKSQRRYTFRVNATYDKAFYCIAKMADNAQDVEVNDDNTVYYVTFRGDQIEEIALTYHALVTPFNSDRSDLSAASEYLKHYNFFSYLPEQIGRYIGEMRQEYGYSSTVTNSSLVSISRAITSYRTKKLNKLYTAMAKENRITTKWGNEYKLFMIVSSLIPDAAYQYRTEWLGQQSFDIYLPGQNIAIEYQGLQHYEAVDRFSGESSLEDNQKRDKKKRELSAEHGVKVLDWKYTVHVNRDNVIAFLEEHGVKYSLPQQETEAPAAAVGQRIQMAPVIAPKEKVRKETPRQAKPSPYVIRQYDLSGKYLCEYDSFIDASEKSGVSEKSIRNVVYGARKSGGGYIWGRCLRDSETVDVAPIIQPSNTGRARRVLMIDSDGEVVREFDSIGKAAKACGISSRGISDVLAGTQKTAGGYGWRYAE